MPPPKHVYALEPLPEEFRQALQASIKTNQKDELERYYNTRSTPADVKQSKRSREYHRKTQNFSNYLPFGNDADFEKYPEAADVIINYSRSRKVTSSKYNILATSPLSLSASVRVHVEVPNR